MTVSEKLEENLWKTAEEFRGQVESSEYKHIVLGMLFLRDASIKFNEFRDEIGDFDVDPEDEEKLLRKTTKSRLPQLSLATPAHTVRPFLEMTQQLFSS